MTAEEWLSRFAAAVGCPPPSPDEAEELLALAGVAAHASERTAAPLTCWLAARARMTAGEALAVARRIAEADQPGSS